MNPQRAKLLALIDPAQGTEFPAGIRDELRSEIERALRPIVDSTGTTDLWVGKRQVAGVHGCEARYLAEVREGFTWNIAAAVGSVAHKALELLIGWPKRHGDPTPLALTHGALARLAEDDKQLGAFISGLDHTDHAQLASQANTLVATFLDLFPPLERAWAPRAESSVRMELCDGRVVVAGRIDLCFGRSKGTTAGKILVDYKGGRALAIHTEDLRLYALLETMRYGTPPRLLMDLYLDSGEARTEAVTEDLLWAAARRLVTAVEKIVALNHGLKPSRVPSVVCRWCPIAESCLEGQQWIKENSHE